MTQDREQTPLDHRLLATFAKEAETADPIDWSGVDIDRSAAYEIMASQIAEMFRDYEMQGIGRDPQMAIALSTIVRPPFPEGRLQAATLSNAAPARPVLRNSRRVVIATRP